MDKHKFNVLSDIKKMFDMEMNSIFEIDYNTDVIRVPGGWIYRTIVADAGVHTTFVSNIPTKT